MSFSLRATGVAFTVFAALLSHGQLDYGGKAFGLMEQGPALAEPPVVTLPPIEPSANDQDAGAGTRFEYGRAIEVSIGMDQGIWTELENGDRIWRITISSPGAKGLGLLFDHYVVPEGALVFMYNEQGRQRGAFMAAPRGRTSLAVDQTPGDRLTIEYFEPAELHGMGGLSIGSITHAFKEAPGGARGFGDSAECNINVVCPEGDNWRDQIRSVVLINTGSSYCTGTLINSCEQDATPYILTSSQCLSGNPANWTFRFNWDSPVCDTTEMPLWQNSLSGSQLLVDDWQTTDVALILLDEVPPPYYQVYFSGWDSTGTTPSQVTSIHHPVGDVKKISHSYHAPGSIDSLGYWVVEDWHEGILETGSNGCGMWNQNGLLTGHYKYGFSFCDTTIFENFSKFSSYYPLIKGHIGECTANMPGLDWDPVIPILVDAGVTSITNVDPLVCGDPSVSPRITLKNFGPTVITSVIFTYGVVGGLPSVAPWTGSLMPGQTYNHLLPPILLPPGDHILQIRSNSPNGEEDDWPFNDQWSIPVSVSAPSHIVNLDLTIDDYGTDVTWKLATQDGAVLYQGGPYADISGGEFVHVPFCLTNGCYTFTINDAYHNGICCQEGEGGYVLQDPNGHILAISDGQYGSQNVDEFCLEAVSVHETAGAFMDLLVYPNPSNGLLEIRLEGPQGMTGISLIDGLGRTVLTNTIAGAAHQHSADLSSLADGLYLLVVETGHGRAVRSVMLQR